MQTILGNSMRLVADRCINGITANKDRCKQYFEASMGLATVLNPLIGYNNAAKIVKTATSKGTPIMDEVRAAVDDAGNPVLSSAEMREAFKPEKLTKPGSLKLKR
jgi:aspartate ammonia-lyase